MPSCIHVPFDWYGGNVAMVSRCDFPQILPFTPMHRGGSVAARDECDPPGDQGCSGPGVRFIDERHRDMSGDYRLQDGDEEGGDRICP